MVSVGLAALLSVAVIAGLWLSRVEPVWWTGPAPAPDAGERLQNSVINQLHLARPTAPGLPAGEPWRSDPWRVSMRSADVNAWLAQELPGWLANRSPPVRWPGEIESVRVEFEAGRVLVGAQVRHGGGSSVISASLEPAMREDGSLWLTASWVKVGRLPAPGSWVVPRVREALRAAGVAAGPGPEAGGAEFMLRVLEGKEPLARCAEIRLDDGRRVRILDLEPRPGALWVTARTQQRGR